MKRLMIVVPCFNEEEALPTAVKELTAVIKDLIKKEKICFSFYLYIENSLSIMLVVSSYVSSNRSNLKLLIPIFWYVFI